MFCEAMLRFLISRRADIFCHSLPPLDVVTLHEKSVGKYHEELTREFLTAQEKKAVDLMDSFKAQT